MNRPVEYVRSAAGAVAEQSAPLRQRARREARWAKRSVRRGRLPAGRTARSFQRALLTWTDPMLHPEDAILEIGSGTGANLAALHAAGYTNLTGVESDPAAVATMRERFPQLRQVPVLVGPAAEVLSGLPDDSYRMIYGFDVFQHAERGSDLFATVARLASTVASVDPVTQDPLWDLAAEFTGLGLTIRKRAAIGRPKARLRVFRRMESLPTLHTFWTQPAPHGNVPESYLKPIPRSRALLSLVSDLPAEARILEVGCNVGRNLAYLADHGYPNVTGIEISPHAVELLRKSYPQLAANEILIGPAGDHLPHLPDNSQDLIFTMAVMEHLHPAEAKPVFDAMVRVAPNVLAIEPTNRLSHRQFPHDVPKEFTGRGMELVSATPMSELVTAAEDGQMRYFTAYRFRRP